MKFKFSLLLCLLSCSSFALEADQKREVEISSQYEEVEYTFEEPFILQDPYNRNPLSALVKFPTENEAQITLTILSKVWVNSGTPSFDKIVNVICASFSVGNFTSAERGFLLYGS